MLCESVQPVHNAAPSAVFVVMVKACFGIYNLLDIYSMLAKQSSQRCVATARLGFSYSLRTCSDVFISLLLRSPDHTERERESTSQLYGISFAVNT